MAVGSDAQWVACARVLGLTSLADDRTLVTNAGRIEHRDRIAAAFAERLITQPAAKWSADLDSAGVPNGAVKSVLEALRDTAASPLTGVPPSVPGTVRFAPPGLDEHGALIRKRGWDAFVEFHGLAESPLTPPR